MQNTAHKEKLVSDVKDVISDSENLMEATVSDLSEKAKEARKELSDRFSASKSKLVKMGEDLKDKAEESLKQTDKVIRAKPYQSLGIAFAVGAIVGVVLNRR